MNATGFATIDERRTRVLASAHTRTQSVDRGSVRGAYHPFVLGVRQEFPPVEMGGHRQSLLPRPRELGEHRPQCTDVVGVLDPRSVRDESNLRVMPCQQHLECVGVDVGRALDGQTGTSRVLAVDDDRGRIPFERPDPNRPAVGLKSLHPARQDRVGRGMIERRHANVTKLQSMFETDRLLTE